MVEELATEICVTVHRTREYAHSMVAHMVSDAIAAHSRQQLGNTMGGDSLELLLMRLHGDAQLSRSKQKDFMVKHKQPLKSIAPNVLTYKGVTPGQAQRQSTQTKRAAVKRKTISKKSKKKRSSMTAVQLAIEQAAVEEEDFEDPDIVKIQAPIKQRTKVVTEKRTKKPETDDVESDGAADDDGGAGAGSDVDVDVSASDEEDEELSPDMQLYDTLLQQYWRETKMIYEAVDLPTKKSGTGSVSTAVHRGSYDFVIGSSSGDLMLYHSHDADTREYPTTLYRKAMGKQIGSGIDAIHKMAWSADGLDVIAVDVKGTVRIFSVVANTLSNPGDVEDFEMIEELTAAEMGFVTGPFVEDGSKGQICTDVDFFPSFTLYGRQPSALVGLASGDILKINFGCGVPVHPEPLMPQDGMQNLVGQGLGAELFRGHRYPIIFMHVGGTGVDNQVTMVTGDNHGYFNVWGYAEDDRTAFGWFAPSTKYHFEFAKEDLQVHSTEPYEMVFTDERVGEDGMRRSKEEIRGLRAATEIKIQRVLSGNKGHCSVVQKMEDKKRTTTVYIVSKSDSVSTKSASEDNDDGNNGSEEDKDADAAHSFHFVSRHKDGVLVEYTVAQAENIMSPCKQVIQVRVADGGHGIVAMALYAPTEVTKPMIQILAVDLDTMVVSDVVVSIPVSLEDYDQICENQQLCTMELTPVLEGLDTDFVITAICGKLRMYCLMTGREVALFHTYVGNLPSEDSAISLLCARGENKFTIIVQPPDESKLHLTHIADYNIISKVEEIRSSVPERAKHRLKYKYGQKLGSAAIAVGNAPAIFRGRLKNGQDGGTVFLWLKKLVTTVVDKAVVRAVAGGGPSFVHQSIEPSLPGKNCHIYCFCRCCTVCVVSDLCCQFRIAPRSSHLNMHSIKSITLHFYR